MKNFEHISYKLPNYGIILFFLLNLLAMIFYSGGTHQNPELEYYKFTQNYFSDLGRTITMDGTQNFFSSFIFNNSLLMIGILFILFFYHLPNLFVDNNISHNLSRIGSWIAITSGFAFAGIGFTPSNLFLDSHLFFVRWAFRSFLIVSILFVFAINKSNEWENKYAFVYIIFSLILLSYILIMDFGPDGRKSLNGLIVQVISQKIIVAAFIVSVFFKSKGALKVYKLS